MGSLTQDARYGLRTMLRSPGLTLVALLSLALGIGANTAIFSLLNAVLLRSLPVHQPSQLVLLGAGEWAGIDDEFPNRNWQLFSNPFYRDLQKKNQAFSSVAAVHSLPADVHAIVDGQTPAEAVRSRLVSGSYFSTLGVHAIVGRTFSDADDRTAGQHPVAVASYSWWERRFGRDPSVVGKTVRMGATAFTIVGVTPREFFGTAVGESPDLWIPLSMMQQVPPGLNGLNDKLFQSLYLLARLKPGITRQQAQAEVNVIFQQALHELAGPHPTQKQLEDMRKAHIELTWAARGLSQLRIQYSLPLQILMAVVALVLLIACANLANLLLARAATRQREIAVRMAMGAGRARLVRQLLTESILLAVAGGVLALGFASWANRLLLAMVSRGPQVVPVDVSLGLRVLAFTFGLSLLTAILFGTLPALRATRLELTDSLREGRGAASAPVRTPLARTLIVSQVALSLVLLFGAGLFLRSLVKLANVDTGFDKRNVLLVELDTSATGLKEDFTLLPLYQQIEQRVSSLPGVQAASFTFLAFNQGLWTQPAATETSESMPERDRDVLQDNVGPNFFAAMGLPLLAGRGFGPQDTEKAPKVAIVNETMARRFFPNQSPLGKRFGIGTAEHRNDIEIVGVVKDAKYEELNEKAHAAVYYPYTQNIGYFDNLLVRSPGGSAPIGEIRRIISEANPNLPVTEVMTLAEQVDRSIAPQTVIARLSAFFGLLAVFLACIGIYGLMSYAVSRLTNEIGIRVALGANRPNVLWLVMREMLALVGVGLAAGVIVALASSHLVSSMLFGLSPLDPASIVAAVAVLVAIAALAAYLPARRATTVDPTIALRYE